VVERSDFAPGDYVRHPQQPDWGLGQVQSAIGHRVTVMFEHAGKVLVDTDNVALEHVDPA
jgi:hypothetical protein